MSKWQPLHLSIKAKLLPNILSGSKSKLSSNIGDVTACWLTLWCSKVRRGFFLDSLPPSENVCEFLPQICFVLWLSRWHIWHACRFVWKVLEATQCQSLTCQWCFFHCRNQQDILAPLCMFQLQELIQGCSLKGTKHNSSRLNSILVSSQTRSEQLHKGRRCRMMWMWKKRSINSGASDIYYVSLQVKDKVCRNWAHSVLTQ